uniref:Cas scaffolding protein family member 4 n=1 Tax=Rousettus aegyptiacus TaxID=9407 RepID=A0A7J8DFM2_ROUAE|nr:Cas scaffold protein family member 4 [Rousettus aegyptiacus]
MRGSSAMDRASKTLLARALYDNCPDCSDELAFCRGDILTILQQNVPQSDGWWKCLLHGRQGLAPANRLQVLTDAPTDEPGHAPLRAPEEAPPSSKESYQVPALLSPPPPSPVYEQMKSWVQGPPPPTAQIYEIPAPAASARIVCEKTLSFSKQALFTVPRPAQASSPALPAQLYDVPTQSRGSPALKEPKKQQLYDVPTSTQRAGCSAPAGQRSRQSVPVMSTVALRKPCYKTLPNPQKSEWLYDTPVSPEKADGRNASLTSSVEKSGPHALPVCTPSLHIPPSTRARSLTPDLHKNVSMQKKLSLPEIPPQSFLVPKDTFPSEESVSYKVPSSFLVLRVEQQNTKPNIYDIPKAASTAAQAMKELEKADGAPENPVDRDGSWFPRQATWPDRSSINSSDSRASVVSSCSSTSTDSSSSCFSEESAKEPSLDLDLAKETVMALQQKVASAVAGLMLFVSRKWRFRDNLEANIDAIHRATDHVEESLREFLDFARGVCGAACNLASSNLQARIRDQLQTVSNSYQVLLETKDTLDGCNWSLEVLVMDEVQSSPDDLERFVMVARMVPEDIKRLASMLIANARLLFKQNCEKEEIVHSTPNAGFKLAKCIQLPQREVEFPQRSAPSIKQRQSELSPELLKKNWTNACKQDPGSPPRRPSGQQDPEKKIHLSEHCRLYFGALFKAIGVFRSSLHHGQPPEVFITHSKLIIMVGQKLVDTLCQETQDRDLRNEILCSSNRLCGLLKNLALATKHAVLKYPSPTALGHLRAEAEKLEQHTRQFRDTLE